MIIINYLNVLINNYSENPQQIQQQIQQQDQQQGQQNHVIEYASSLSSSKYLQLIENQPIQQ
jgi:hypothetical protein